MSFLSRLLLLVLVAVLAPVLLLGYHQLQQRDEHRAEALRFASLRAEAVAAELNQILLGIRQMLVAIAHAPVIRRFDAAACGYLADLRELDEQLLFSMLDARGRVVCGGEERGEIDASDRLYFKLAKETGDFSVGEYTIDRLTGRRAIHLSYPVTASGGQFSGVVIARLGVDALADQLSLKPLPQGTAVTIVDQHGTIIVDLPGRKRVGEMVARDQLPTAANAQASAASVSPFDGERRLMAYAPAGTSQHPFVVAVGLAEALAFAELDHSTRRLVLFILIGLLLALLAAWLAGRYGLQRPIFVLNAAARRWAAGDYAARTGLSGRSELDRLGQTFDRMAEALQTRDRERADHEEQLRRSRDKAVEANEDKSRFLASASHDLRQPLQALSMGITVLEEKHRGDEQTSVMVARVKRSVQSLTDLLNALLDIAALDSGSITPQLADFPIAPVLQSLREQFAQAALAKGLSLHIEECDASVHSDPQHLHRMLRNLVDNAVKFTAAGGGIHVVCRTHDDRVEIEVSDTGIGVSQEEQRAIFQDFNQLDNPERSRSKGLGLGLAVVERMSRLLHHPVKIESSPGKGSTFTVEVPRAPETVGIEIAGHPAKANARVLLVEDDPLVAEATVELLKTWGARVELARSAEEAIAIIGRAREEYQAVIADYRLPAASGLDVVAHAILRWPRIKAAIITGDRESVTHEKIIAEGVHLLEKPVRASQLAALLGRPAVERTV